VTIVNGTTTASQVVDALDDLDGSANVTAEASDGDVVLRVAETLVALSGTLDNGEDAAPASVDWVIDGVTIEVTAASAGTAANAYSFRLISAVVDSEGTVLDGTTPVTVVRDGNLFVVAALAGVATHADVVDALDAETLLLAEIATDSGPSAVLDLPVLTLTGGANADPATGTLNFGAGNTMAVTSENPGDGDNGIIILVAGGGAEDTGVTAAWAAGTRTLTLTFETGVSTLEDIESALNANTDIDVTAVLTGSGEALVTATSVTLQDGANAEQASDSYSFGAETLTVRAGTAGDAANGIVIRFDGLASEAGTSWDAGSQVLTVSYVDGTTTWGAIETLIKAVEDVTFETTLSGGNATVLGSTLIEMTGGEDAAPATTEITLTDGRVLSIEAEGATGGASFNDGVVVIRVGGAAAASASSGVLTLTVVEGDTTLADLQPLLPAPFSISITGDDSLPLYVLRGAATAGTAPTDSFAELRAPGPANDLRVEVDPAFDGYTLRYGDGGAGSDVTVTVQPGDSTISIQIDYGATSAAEILTALNAIDGITATLLTEVDAAEVHDGSGFVNPAAGSATALPDVDMGTLEKPESLVVVNGDLYLIATDAEGDDVLVRLVIDADTGAASLSDALAVVDRFAGLRVAGNALYFVQGDTDVVSRFDTATDTTTAIATAPGGWAVLSDTAVVVIDAEGAVKRYVGAEATLSATRVEPWAVLVTATVGGDSLLVVETSGDADVLYRVTGAQATPIYTAAAGHSITMVVGVGDQAYMVTQVDATQAATLWRVGTEITAVTIDGETPDVANSRFESFVALDGGAQIAFVYRTGGSAGSSLTNKLAVIDVDADAAAATTVRDLGSGLVSEMTALNADRLYFRFGNARGAYLWTSDLTFAGTVRATNPRDPGIVQAANPSQLTVFDGRLYFAAPVGAVPGSFWVSLEDETDASVVATAPLIDLVESVVPELRVSVLDGDSDGVINSADALADATVLLRSARASNAALIDVTEVIRARLAAGQTRVTFLLSLDLDAGAIPTDGFTIAHAMSGAGSRLDVVTGSAEAVTGSLYSADGRLLQSNQAVIDLSQLRAGTYFLRINGTADEIALIERGAADEADNGPSLGAGNDYTYFIRDNVLWRSNGFLGDTEYFEGVVRSGPLAADVVEGADLQLVLGSGDRFYFTRGTELWQISGTFATVVGELGGTVDEAVAVGDRLIFRVGAELYAAEGETLTLLHDYGTDTVSDLTASGDRAVYLVAPAAGFGRWYATDGSVAGTGAMDVVDARGQAVGDVIAAGGSLFYLVEDAGSLTLWRATPGEGQAYGAEPLRVRLLADQLATDWALLGVADFNVLFTVTTAAGTQLWISNGVGDPLLGGQTPGTIRISEDIGGAAQYIGTSAGRMFFVIDNGDGTTSLWSSEGTEATTFVVVEDLPGAVTDHVTWNGETWFIAGPNLSPLLWKVTEAGVQFQTFLPVFANNLTAAGNRLAFTAVYEDDTTSGPSLWVTDGTAAGTTLVVELSPVNPGTISDIAYTDNGIVFMVANNAAVLDGFVDYSLWISNGFRDGTYPLLSSNGGTLPFGTFGSESVAPIRPSLLRVVGAVAFYAFDGRILVTDGTAAGSRILNPDVDITPVDTLESDGRLVILDDAGRLWVTQGNLVGVPFKIEVKAPVPGMTHAFSDRDFLNGGEGDDILIGNGDHDRIFGGGGENFFIAERKEIRDLQSYEDFTLPPTEQFSVQQPRQPDTEVWIPDINLRAAIAEALGIPVTEGFNGLPVIHGTIMASDLATLVELQAADRGIQSVVGLHFARNLRVLNLNDNRISDLSILVPATDPVSGARTGLSNLRVFSMDYNGMGILTFNGYDDTTGFGEYVDFEGLISEIQSTVTFWFRTEVSGEAMGLFSMDSGVRGAAGLDRSIFLDASGNIGAMLYGGASLIAFYNELPNDYLGYEVIRSSGTNFADGEWHHVAYVFSSNDNVGQRLYVDGVLVAEGKLTSSSMSVQDGFNLGYGHVVDQAGFASQGELEGEYLLVEGGLPQTPGSAAYFRGDMDELRIWDAAFTDVLVNADMISDYAGERVSLVGYWSFDQGHSQRVIDHSLFGRNGVLGGGNPDRAPAFNRMQPDPTIRPEPGHPSFAGVTSERTLFSTVIRDLGRLNVPGPLEQVSLAYTRIDVLDPLSNLPAMNFIDLTGVITPATSTLAVVVDHTDLTEAQTRLFETKDGTTFAVDGDRTLVLSAGTWAWRRLTVGAGVDGDEAFELEVSGDNLIVRAFGVEQVFALSAFDQIVFDGGNGDDTLTLIGDLTLPLFVSAGAGDDDVMGGLDTTYLFGGAGDDVLRVMGGFTVATGGTGNDTFAFVDGWGEAVLNENPTTDRDTLDFSAVTADLEINVRGISQTADGLNTVSHLANAFERFVGGTGDDIMNLHREQGGLLELGAGELVWDSTAITHAGIERIDVRFVDADGERTGVVRVLADQDYTGSELRLEAKGIDIRAAIKADGLSLVATNIIGIRQDFNVQSGLGRVLTLEADRMRLEADNGVGDVDMPLYVKAGTLEARSAGAAGIYLVELDDAIIGDVDFGTIGADTVGLSTGAGGNIHLTNLIGTITVDSAIQASGGRVVITGERMTVNAQIASVREIGGQTFRGTLVLQPLSTRSTIGMATTGAQAGQTLHFSADEIARFMSGFDSAQPATYLAAGQLVRLPAVSGINIGRADGCHVISLGAFTYTESFTFRAPQPFGRFDVLGQIRLEPSVITGNIPTLTFLGWRN
jgi:ELWxxDGT repeat protein